MSGAGRVSPTLAWTGDNEFREEAVGYVGVRPAGMHPVVHIDVYSPSNGEYAGAADISTASAREVAALLLAAADRAEGKEGSATRGYEDFQGRGRCSHRSVFGGDGFMWTASGRCVLGLGDDGDDHLGSHLMRFPRYAHRTDVVAVRTAHA